MITTPLFEACIAVGGRSSKPISPTDYYSHYTQNSREVGEGSIFVALKGERVDGHDFAKQIEQSGAVAIIVEYAQENISIPQIVVPSTVEALGQLAKIRRGRLEIPVIAVTGSVGKTSTKEMIATILSTKYKTHKSRKNFNNQLGVPIELGLLDSKHECSVLEFGMRGRDQINYLSKIARPTISVITNIGMSHIEMLKSRENIALAKAEIFEGMDVNGVAVLNADDEFFELIAAKAPCRIISFGESPEADIRLSNIQLNRKGNPGFLINGVEVSMNKSVGRHHAYNAAAAFAVGLELGIRQEDMATSLAAFNTPEMRGVFSRAKNGAMLLDNTYNAGPDSVKSSLYNLSEMGNSDPNIKTVAVIGEMLELGDYSEEAHKHIGAFIADLNINSLITVGYFAEFIGKSANLKEWNHFDNANLAAHHLLEVSDCNDVILLQGSRKISLNLVVEMLEKGEIL